MRIEVGAEIIRTRLFHGEFQIGESRIHWFSFADELPNVRAACRGARSVLLHRIVESIFCSRSCIELISGSVRSSHHIIIVINFQKQLYDFVVVGLVHILQRVDVIQYFFNFFDSVRGSNPQTLLGRPQTQGARCNAMMASFEVICPFKGIVLL